MSPSARSLPLVVAIARGLCPRCRRAAVFRGLVAMHERCAACHLVFEREHGYFVGAMYVNYVLAIAVMSVLTAAVYLLRPGWPLEALIGMAAVLFLPFVPLLIRYSRILWMYFNQWVDPQ